MGKPEYWPDHMWTLFHMLVGDVDHNCSGAPAKKKPRRRAAGQFREETPVKLHHRRRSSCDLVNTPTQFSPASSKDLGRVSAFRSGNIGKSCARA
jgi:hypothetical protein